MRLLAVGVRPCLLGWNLLHGLALLFLAPGAQSI